MTMNIETYSLSSPDRGKSLKLKETISLNSPGRGKSLVEKKDIV